MNYLSPQDIAEQLSVKRSTVWRWIREGKLKAVKFSKNNYRVSEEDLQSFIDEHKK